jgi:hypothetical protein
LSLYRERGGSVAGAIGTVLRVGHIIPEAWAILFMLALIIKRNFRFLTRGRRRYGEAGNNFTIPEIGILSVSAPIVVALTEPVSGAYGVELFRI